MNRRSVFTLLAIAAVSLPAAMISAVMTPASAQVVIGVAPQPAYYGTPQWRHAGTRWDRDRDGIPNRYDRYDNRYRGRHGWGDRDRDGIPNRWDRYDNRSAYGWRDSDRDGVPNRWDRYDYNPYRR